MVNGSFLQRSAASRRPLCRDQTASAPWRCAAAVRYLPVAPAMPMAMVAVPPNVAEALIMPNANV